MIEVVAIQNYKPQDGDVRIDRMTKWGNPFKMGIDGTREEVIEMYKDYIQDNLFLIEELKKLRPKRLLCWCAPKACHGDVLVEMLTL